MVFTKFYGIVRATVRDSTIKGEKVVRFNTLKHRYLTFIITLMTIAINGMEQSTCLWVKTDDGYITEISRKNIKRMARLSVAADMQSKKENSYAYLLQPIMVNRDQLELLNDAVSAS